MLRGHRSGSHETTTSLVKVVRQDPGPGQRQRSRRVRSRRPDRLAGIRQENEIKTTERKKIVSKSFIVLLNCF